MQGQKLRKHLGGVTITPVGDEDSLKQNGKGGHGSEMVTFQICFEMDSVDRIQIWWAREVK